MLPYALKTFQKKCNTKIYDVCLYMYIKELNVVIYYDLMII